MYYIYCYTKTLSFYVKSNKPDSNSVTAYPDQLTVALFGKKIELKNIIGNTIFSDGNAFTTTSEKNLVWAQNSSFKIINTPDFFDEESLHPDQQIIDFMALSYPGPDLFILSVDSENIQKEKVMAQVIKLQETFGEKVTAHLVVMLPNIESFNSLSHLNDLFSIWLQMNDENLARECRKTCCGRQGFLFDYKNYSQDVVMRRRTTLERRRYTILYYIKVLNICIESRGPSARFCLSVYFLIHFLSAEVKFSNN